MNTPIFPADADAGMQRAVLAARQSFPVLWREMTWEYRRIVPGLSIAAVKAPFSDTPDPFPADDREHMWLNELSFDGVTIEGTLLNAPNSLTSVQQGQRVETNPETLTDWMYGVVTEKEVCGAFSINHMRAAMNDQERAEHDAAWPVEFGDPTEVRFVPSSYLPAKKSRALGGMFGAKKPANQQLDEVMAQEHPMALNMIEKLKEAISEPAQVMVPDENGVNFLHSMTLGGAASAVDYLMQVGADASVATNHGLTPYRIAERMGWRSVIAVLHRHGVMT